jgi:CubicO group peptidase (beta-lactamase class C family)
MDPNPPPLAFDGVQNLTLDAEAMKAHVMRPEHGVGVISSRGRHEGTPFPAVQFPHAPSYHFDVVGFAQSLHFTLKDSVVGYVMRLRQNGGTIYTLYWNWAKTPIDGGEGWSPELRMHVASCSKLITAMAMTLLLNDKQISYDAPIIDHLPNYWAKGQNVDKITFRHLMTHTSGLNYNVSSSASDFEFMMFQIAVGVTKLGQYWYQNMNFGLCRILIATINGNIATSTIFDPPYDNDQMWDYVTIQSYALYVNQNVFTPAGVSRPSFNHSIFDALAYTFPVFGNGWNSGNLASFSGGAGWHMSVDELLNVMGAFRRQGTIMSPAQAQTMLDNGFGVDVTNTTPLGTMYNKNGLWQDGAGRTEQSLAYFLPQDMELVVVANSPVGWPSQFFRDVVSNIYLANIKP